MLTFGLYADQKDGTPVWTEQQLVTLDADGRYSVILGSTSAEGLPAGAFAAGTPRWLGVQVEGDKEQPRFMLLSVPYALKAGDADTVAGKPVSEFVLSANLSDTVKSAMKDTDPSAPLVTVNALVKYSTSGGGTTESSTVDVGGKLGVQVAAPIGELDIAGFGSTTTMTLRNGGKAADVVKLVGADGSLRIGSATNANLVNLIGANVGIGTTTPADKLTVQTSGYGFTQTDGTVTVGSWVGGGGGWYGTKSNHPLHFFTNNSVPLMTITPSGNVGIGTSSPDRRLTVQGPDSSPSYIAFQAENASGAFALRAWDDRTVSIGALFGSSTTHACFAGFDLNFAACSSAAEYVPTPVVNPHGPPDAGDLVSIAPAAANPYGDEHAPFVVAKSATACDANLLGFLIDPASGADGKKLNDQYLPLAIYGYFPAKVTIENGAVKRGDPITSSSKPGVGMKSTGACRIIGYALEDADQDGTIQVFAHLSESTAPVAAPLQTDVAALRRENADLLMRLERLEQALAAILADRSGAAVERR
jgi:hypothetical protein